jgi:hypothetical protein
MGDTLKNLKGMTFGRLTVLSRGENHGNLVRWLCRCSCGNERLVFGNNLRQGYSASCGCARSESCAAKCKARTIHGHCANGTETPEYTAWQNIHDRCYNPKYENFHRYGGRGIQVCIRWDEFEDFLSDMWLKPVPKYSIDRINNDWSYMPSNCRWATAREQNLNRKQCARDTITGRFLPNGI